MKTEFRESFLKDLRAIRDKQILAKIKSVIESIEKAESLDTVPNLKKLQGAKGHYRVRIGDFRIGLSLSDDIITFVRFLNRKEIYRYFP